MPTASLLLVPLLEQLALPRVVKRSVLTDGQGGPLAVVVGPANRNDQLLLAATLEAVEVPRPEPGEATPQRLCVDLGYAGQPAQEVIAAHHDEGQVTFSSPERSSVGIVGGLMR